MSKVRITPTKHRIQGVAVGDTLEVSAREAKILVAVGRAEYATAPKRDKARRVYQRRDMVAETAAPEPAAQPAPPPDEA